MWKIGVYEVLMINILKWFNIKYKGIIVITY